MLRARCRRFSLFLLLLLQLLVPSPAKLALHLHDADSSQRGQSTQSAPQQEQRHMRAAQDVAQEGTSDTVTGPSYANVELWNWLVDGGADVSKVTLAKGEFGRCVLATRPIAEHELVMSIPETLVIGLHSLKHDPLLQTALDSYDGLHDWDVNALIIVREFLLGQSSFYFPYFNTVPQPNAADPSQSELYRTSVVYAPDAARRILPNSPNQIPFTGVETQLSEQRARAVKFMSIHPDLFPVAAATHYEEYYKWAQAMLMSRAWTKLLKTGDRELIPLADMVNHNTYRGRMFRGHEKAGMMWAELRAHQQYEPGDEVYDVYIDPDVSCESQLVMFYGFADDDYSCLDFTLTLPAAFGEEQFQLRGRDPLPDDLMAFARQWALLELERHLWSVGDQVKLPDIEELREVQDLKVETTAIKLLYDRFKALNPQDVADRDRAQLEALRPTLRPIEQQFWMIRIHEMELIVKTLDTLQRRWMALLE